MRQNVKLKKWGRERGAYDFAASLDDVISARPIGCSEHPRVTASQAVTSWRQLAAANLRVMTRPVVELLGLLHALKTPHRSFATTAFSSNSVGMRP